MTTAPKDPDRNRLYRAHQWGRCDTPARRRDAIEHAAQDMVWWIDTWGMQYNPKPSGPWTPRVGPFILWDFQERLLARVRQCIEDGEDLVIEKSRDMGVSWFLLFYITHAYLFHSWENYLVISRNELAVDRPGDPDCLFWKIDHVLERLPEWMVRCDLTRARRKMGFNHPLTRCAITGQASTGKAGVGGRCTAMFIDEFSQIDEAYEVLQRTSDTTSCRIFNGTHAPSGLAFAEITDRNTVAGSFIRKEVLHWTEHPDKRRGRYRYNSQSGRVEVLDETYHFPPDYEFQYTELPTGGPRPGIRSPYYDQQVKRKGSTRAVAMDLDIDRGGGSSKFFDPVMLSRYAERHCCEPYWVGDVKHDPDSGHPVELVESRGGPLRLWIRPADHASVPKGNYAAGCDISQGLGNTPSCCSIGDALTGRKVAEYVTSEMPPDKFALAVTALCWLFKNESGLGALVCWETNAGPGGQFGKTLRQVGYGRKYKRKTASLVPRPGDPEIEGWRSNDRTKMELLSDYRMALTNSRVINHSRRAIEQCEPYHLSDQRDCVTHPRDLKGQDPSVSRSNHGDLPIADAQMWMVMQSLGAGKPPAKPGDEPAPEVTWKSAAGRRLMRQRQQRESEAWA
jgi:hypothetical protein